MGEKISAELGFELGAAGWESRMLRLCDAEHKSLKTCFLSFQLDRVVFRKSQVVSVEILLVLDLTRVLQKSEFRSGENFRFENCIKTRVCCNFCGSSKTQHFSKASIQQGRHKKDKISKQQFLNRVWERESSQEVGLNKTRSNRVGCFAK